MKTTKEKLQEIYDAIQEGYGRKTSNGFNPSDDRFNEISNLVSIVDNASKSIKELLDEI